MDDASDEIAVMEITEEMLNEGIDAMTWAIGQGLGPEEAVFATFTAMMTVYDPDVAFTTPDSDEIMTVAKERLQ